MSTKGKLVRGAVYAGHQISFIGSVLLTLAGAVASGAIAVASFTMRIIPRFSIIWAFATYTNPDPLHPLPPPQGWSLDLIAMIVAVIAVVLAIVCLYNFARILSLKE